MELEQLQALVLTCLDDMKAKDVKLLDVRGKSNITDLMVIACGTSTRHVKSIANAVAVKAKEAGYPPLGEESDGGTEWALVDLNDIVVHIMTQQSRDFYNLEKLWGVEALPMASNG